LRFTTRDTGLDGERLDQIAAYWQAVRQFYAAFESEVLPATSDLYRHEMPGGQYTNLYEQARALGLADRWRAVCAAYAEVNQMLGDIVKVTPTSKAVGDMALFLVANNLTPYEVLYSDRELAFPASVIDLVAGRMGQPPGGFPEAVRQRILRGEPAFEDRPGETLPPADFTAAGKKVQELSGQPPQRRDIVTYLLYPKVFEEFAQHQTRYSDTSHLPTPTFFYGQQSGQEIEIDIEKGKTLIVKYLTMSDPHPDGTRTVFFELNGQPRDVTVADNSLAGTGPKVVKADPSNPGHVGASMPGMVVTVAVQPGDSVAKGQKLLTLEAMKMEATIYADRDGKVAELFVKPASQVETGDLLLTLE
jgi:pyruvate carboxylase